MEINWPLAQSFRQIEMSELGKGKNNNEGDNNNNNNRTNKSDNHLQADDLANLKYALAYECQKACCDSVHCICGDLVGVV